MDKAFSLLIKPVSADCNLRCRYCFYLDKAELYPDSAVHRMPDQVLEQIISGYMATRQPVYSFGWQGGEPTLAGLDFFRKAVSLQQKYGNSGALVSNGLQTNATLIDDEFAAFLREYSFLVGVSVDGPAILHDHYRQTAVGTGTHADVLRGIGCLTRHKVDVNALTLVSSANVRHVKDVYHYLCDQGFDYHQYIPCVEHDRDGNPMPWSIDGDSWGEFLCSLFDVWHAKDISRISIRLFDSILTLMLDNTRTICHIGNNCCQYFMVEYNGDVYPCDFFADPALKLGNVMDVDWKSLQVSDIYLRFGAAKSQRNELCRECIYLNYCMGDCLKHRIPDNRALSSLCSGWKMFFEHSLPRFRAAAKEMKKQGAGTAEIPNVGRNDMCPCGSGKKYKKCHGMNK